MATLYLVRHGETDWNVSRRVMGRNDTPLNARGEAQVKALAEVMKRFPVDGVLSSPQLRARQTAEAVAGSHKLTVVPDLGLAEVDFPPAGRERIGKEIQSDPVFEGYLHKPAEAEHEGFESIPAVQARMVGVAERVVREQGEGKFVLVSHADPLRALLSPLIKYPLAEFRHLRVSNASLTLLTGDFSRWLLKLFNYRCGEEIFSDRW